VARPPGPCRTDFQVGVAPVHPSRRRSPSFEPPLTCRERAPVSSSIFLLSSMLTFQVRCRSAAPRPAGLVFPEPVTPASSTADNLARSLTDRLVNFVNKSPCRYPFNAIQSQITGLSSVECKSTISSLSIDIEWRPRSSTACLKTQPPPLLPEKSIQAARLPSEGSKVGVPLAFCAYIVFLALGLHSWLLLGIP